MLASDSELEYDPDDEEEQYEEEVFGQHYFIEEEFDVGQHAANAAIQSARADNGTTIDVIRKLFPSFGGNVFMSTLPRGHEEEGPCSATALPNNLFDIAGEIFAQFSDDMKKMLSGWGKSPQPVLVFDADRVMKTLNCSVEDIQSGRITVEMIFEGGVPTVIKCLAKQVGNNSYKNRIGGGSTWTRPDGKPSFVRSNVFIVANYDRSTNGPWNDIVEDSSNLESLLILARYYVLAQLISVYRGSDESLITVCRYNEMRTLVKGGVSGQGDDSNISIKTINNAGNEGLHWRMTGPGQTAFIIKLCMLRGEELQQLRATAMSNEVSLVECERIRNEAHDYRLTSLLVLSEHDPNNPNHPIPRLKFSTIKNICGSGMVTQLRTGVNQQEKLNRGMIEAAMVVDPRGLRDETMTKGMGTRRPRIDRNGNKWWITIHNRVEYNAFDIPENKKWKLDEAECNTLLYGEGDEEEEEEEEEEESDDDDNDDDDESEHDGSDLVDTDEE